MREVIHTNSIRLHHLVVNTSIAVKRCVCASVGVCACMTFLKVTVEPFQGIRGQIPTVTVSHTQTGDLIDLLEHPSLWYIDTGT